MISYPFLRPLLFFSSVLFAFHLVTATHFSFSQSQSIHLTLSDGQQNGSQYLPIATPFNQVFGLSSQGIATASLNFSLNDTTTPCPARLSLCQVSDAFVRGPNYQRRQTHRPFVPLAEAFAATACQSSQNDGPQLIDNVRDPEQTDLAFCVSHTLCPNTTSYRYSVHDDNLQPNEMYLIGIALCYTKEQYLNISLNGRIEFRNPDLPFPQLGYEEVLFPIFSATIIILLSLPFLLLAIALLFTWRRGMPIRRTVQFVVGAISLKLLGAVLTFVHFYTLAQTGTRQGWYLYVRLLLASSSDVLFIIALVSISSGYAVMPSSWFVEDRSPIFLVYIGVVLQLLIIIAVKIMFPFRYLGAVTYVITGSAIALIASFSSYRNARFLQRFGELIESCHIFLKSTPIPQLRSFYIFNIGMVAVAYIIKMISVILFDYRLNRPDLLWGTMETVDAAILVWLAVFVFPRAKSALYVDMSNLSNERLHRADGWRARQVDQQTSNETGASISSTALRRGVPEGRNAVLSATTAARDDRSDEQPNQGEQGRNTQARLARRAETLLRRGRVQQSGVGSGQANTTSEGLNSGRRENVEDGGEAEPAWLWWTSGGSLPRPTSYTWRGRHRDGRGVRRESRATPFILSAIVVGSAEGCSDIVKLRVGVPVAGKNNVLKAFDEKGAEERESVAGGRSEEQGVNGGEGEDVATSSRLIDIGGRFGLGTRRQNRVGERHGEGVETRGVQTERSVAGETVGATSEVGDGAGEARVEEISRSLSSSTTEAWCDGSVTHVTVSNVGD